MISPPSVAAQRVIARCNRTSDGLRSILSPASSPISAMRIAIDFPLKTNATRSVSGERIHCPLDRDQVGEALHGRHATASERQSRHRTRTSPARLLAARGASGATRGSDAFERRASSAAAFVVLPRSASGADREHVVEQHAFGVWRVPNPWGEMQIGHAAACSYFA